MEKNVSRIFVNNWELVRSKANAIYGFMSNGWVSVRSQLDGLSAPAVILDDGKRRGEFYERSTHPTR